MLRDEFLGVLAVDAVCALIASVVEQEIVANARTDETLLDAGHGIDSMVNVQQGGVVCVEILADFRMNARGTLALVAKVEVLAVHGVHVGRGSAEVTQIALEIGQLADGLDLAQDAFLAA